MSIAIQEQIKSCLYRLKQVEDQNKDLKERVEVLERKEAERKKTLGLKNG